MTKALDLCLPKVHSVDEGNKIVLASNGKPKVYSRRWWILAAFSAGYFTWNLHSLRQVPLVAEYASYFDTTNEFDPADGELGIDFLNILDSSLLVLFYPVAGVLVDHYGLRMMVFGGFIQAASAWWFYLAFSNFPAAIISRIPTSFGGALIASCFLRITMQWFPEKERPRAIGIGVIFSELGAGAALIFGPFFYKGEGETILDISLKSCLDSFLESIDVDNIENLTCTEEAEEDFCCRVPTYIETYNLVLAIMTTCVAVFILIVTREAPESAPSKGGQCKKSPSFWHGVWLMFSNRNYSQICVADFIMSGPPQLLFAVLSRVFPSSVQEYDFIAGAAGLGLAIPAAAIFAHLLAKHRKYFDYTAGAYTSGAIFWATATLCLAIATDVADVFFLLMVAPALITLILWSISVYELKMEYVFSPEFHLEGFIVGVDRTILNLSAVIFLVAIPPERIDSEIISGRLFTFMAGLGFMIIGTTVVWTTPNRRLYKRKVFEEADESELIQDDSHEENEGNFLKSEPNISGEE